jgi:hypothetical protein
MPRLRTVGGITIAALALAACQGATATPSPSPSLAAPSESAGASPYASAGASASGSVEGSPSESGGVLGAGSSASPTLNQIVVVFKDVGGSKVTGGAFVTEVGQAQTSVSIGVIAIGVTDPMPAGIYEGSCPNVSGTPQYKLGDLQTGASNTVIDASIDSLTSSPHAIGIFDPKTATKLVSCGDITR